MCVCVLFDFFLLPPYEKHNLLEGYFCISSIVAQYWQIIMISLVWQAQPSFRGIYNACPMTYSDNSIYFGTWQKYSG